MTKQVLQQALEALEMLLEFPNTGPATSASRAAIEALREALAQPEPLPPPPECQTEAEKTAYAFGWFKALEVNRAALAQQGEQQPNDAIIRAWQAGFYHAGYTNDQAYADKMAREYAGAAPAAQPETWTDDGGWTFPIEKPAQPQDDRLEGAMRIQMKRDGQWHSVTKVEEVVNTAEYRRGIRDACEQFAKLDGNTYADMVLEHFGLKGGE